jgi:hypothetical protein
MNQKLQDLATLLKNDRKTQVIAGAVFLAVMFLIFSEPKRPVAPKRDMKLAAGTGAATSDERYSDLITRFGGDLEAIREQTHQTSQILEEQRQKHAEFEKRTAEIFKRVLERVSEVETAAVSAGFGGVGGGPNLGGPGGAGSISGIGSGGAHDPLAAGVAGAGGGLSDPFGAGGFTGAGGMPGSALPGMAGGGMGGAQAMNVGYQGGGAGLEADAPESFGFDDQRVAPPAPPPVKPVAVVGEGDSVRVRVLAGVNAPTDGTPYPVVLQLIGDVNGPDGSQLPLGEARMIAAAQGSLTDGRALFRLSSLNIRLPNGRRKIIDDIDGYIVGEDGKLGMEGVLIDPLSKILGAVTVAGAIEGTGQAFAQQQLSVYRNAWGGTETEVTGDVFKYGLGRGVQQGSKEWSNMIKQRADQLVPHVEVLSGREGTAVFSKSFVITDLYEALSADEEEGSL